MFVIGSPTFAVHFLGFGPDLGCLVLETANLQMIFAVLDPDLGHVVLDPKYAMLEYRRIPRLQDSWVDVNHTKNYVNATSIDVDRT